MIKNKYKKKGRKLIIIYFLILLIISTSYKVASNDSESEVINNFYSTYVNGNPEASLYSMIVDESNDIYFVGNNYGDIIVGKISSDCTTMYYFNSIGGSGIDQGTGIAIDKYKNIYITGTTTSKDFPITDNAYNKSLNFSGEWSPSTYLDIFIIKINGTTYQIEYSTYIGSIGWDYSEDIEVDDEGKVYITGGIYHGFPGLPPEIPPYYAIRVAFIFKIDININNIEYVLKLVNERTSSGMDLTLDEDKNCYITGYTLDGLITTKDVFDNTFNGGNSDVFITKLDQEGNIEYSTYIGGSGTDEGHGIAIDTDGYAYITGRTQSGNSMSLDFPTTLGSYLPQLDPGISASAFLLKFDRYGQSLNYSTFLKGTIGYCLCLDKQNNAYVGGMGFNIEIAYGAYNKNGDAFIIGINSKGEQMIYSTYIGGSSSERIHGINLLIGSNSIVTSGWTTSFDFPISDGAYDSQWSGGYSGFVFVLNLTIIPYPPQDLMIGYGEGGGYELNWNEPRNDGGSSVLGYKLYRSEGDGNFVVIADLLENLTYTDRTVDLSKVYRYYVTAYNIMGESLPSNIVTNLDMSPPELMEDLSPGRAYTGDPLVFKVLARDDWYLMGVNVIYNHGRISGRNISLVKGENDNWSVEVMVSDDLSPIEYMFYAFDLQGNNIRSVNRTIDVVDNDAPYLKEDLSDRIGTTGDKFELKAKVEDNIEVSYCSFFYSLNRWKEVELEAIEDDDGNWRGEIYFPNDVIGSLRYRLMMEDTSKNKNITEPNEVNVLDNDAPEIVGDHTNREGMMGRSLRFKVEVLDNIGVKGVRVLVGPKGGSRTIELKKSLQELWEGNFELPEDEWTIG